MKSTFVKLNLIDKVIYYNLTVYFLSTYFIVISLMLFNKVYDTELILIISNFLVIPALIFYIIQRQFLRYWYFNIYLTKTEFNSLVKEISKKYSWQIFSFSNDEAILKTNAGIINQNWGQHISIRYTSNTIFFNSIHDLSKGLNTFTNGQNRRNKMLIEKLLVEYIKK